MSGRVVRHYGKTSVSFELHEDDANSFDYQQDAYRIRTLQIDAEGRLNIETSGKDPRALRRNHRDRSHDTLSRNSIETSYFKNDNGVLPSGNQIFSGDRQSPPLINACGACRTGRMGSQHH